MKKYPCWSKHSAHKSAKEAADCNLRTYQVMESELAMYRGYGSAHDIGARLRQLDRLEAFQRAICNASHEKVIKFLEEPL